MSDSDLAKLNKYMGGTDDAAQFISGPSDGSKVHNHTVRLYSVDGELQGTVHLNPQDELLEAARAIVDDITFLMDSLGIGKFENGLEIYKLARANMEKR